MAQSRRSPLSLLHLPPQGAPCKHANPLALPTLPNQGAKAKLPSPVHLPDHRFDARQSQMPQPPSAVQPGKGAIPINPFGVSGKPIPAKADPDDFFPVKIAR